MKSNFYITRNGKLIRHQNTVYFVYKKEDKIQDTPTIEEENDGLLDTVGDNDLSTEPEFEKRALPIERIGGLFIYGRVSLTSGVISFLARNHIPLHFFGYYGHYESTLIPRDSLLSGEVHVNQAAHWLDRQKRLNIAKLFVEGSAMNIRKNLEYHRGQGKDVGDVADHIATILERAKRSTSISELMAHEGAIRNAYYDAFDEILGQRFCLDGRSRRPPHNPLNAMISFGNSLLYSATINAIYHTQLDQTISFLHEPAERRFSLALDISEIFKPLIVDRTIFALINRGAITEEDFDQELNSCLLNDKGKRKFLSAYEDKMSTTIKHRQLNRKVSYQRLIYLESIKLVKHVMGLKPYRPFVIWW